MLKIIVKLVFCMALCSGHNVNVQVQQPNEKTTGPDSKFSEKIGNFSIELLFHTLKTLENGQNFIMSPITVWSVLAVIAEGAWDDTRYQINSALRLSARDKEGTRLGFRNITQWLQVNTSTVQLVKINAIFLNKERLPLPDFTDIAKNFYQTELITLDFKDSANAANILNQAISKGTHGKIVNMVEPSYFRGTQMVLTSALYFKAQWSIPFNELSTSRMPFYDSNGQKIGEVNMMYNRHTYAFSNIKALQARVIGLPYGDQNRLSMFIMLPNPGVSLEDMFMNFKNINLRSIFEELRVSKEEYSDYEVDCFIPRFKIKSDIDLTNVLKTRMGIQQLFDQSKARLPHIARTPIYVSKVVHKVEIEVTEEGTEAAGLTVAEFINRTGVIQFNANRPFSYIIVEKVTNSIVFGGFYRQPSLD